MVQFGVDGLRSRDVGVAPGARGACRSERAIALSTAHRPAARMTENLECRPSPSGHGRTMIVSWTGQAIQQALAAEQEPKNKTSARIAAGHFSSRDQPPPIPFDLAQLIRAR
jgi:hypothetical protein